MSTNLFLGFCVKILVRRCTSAGRVQKFHPDISREDEVSIAQIRTGP